MSGTRERRKQSIQQEILDAAREVFVTDGYEAASMRRIAEKAGYSAAGLYRHFRDKDALLSALVNTDFALFTEQARPRAVGADPVELIRRAGLAYVEFGISHPQQYRLLFMMPGPSRAEPTAGHGDPAYDRYASLREGVRAALAQGRFRKDLGSDELLAQALWALVHGVVALHIVKDGHPGFDWQEPLETARVLIDAALSGLTAPSPRKPQKTASKSRSRK